MERACDSGCRRNASVSGVDEDPLSPAKLGVKGERETTVYNKLNQRGF